MSAQVLDSPHVHSPEHMSVGAAAVRAESEEAEDRRCHMPCGAESSCFGRCHKAYNHGGPHECDQVATHTW